MSNLTIVELADAIRQHSGDIGSGASTDEVVETVLRERLSELEVENAVTDEEVAQKQSELRSKMGVTDSDDDGDEAALSDAEARRQELRESIRERSDGL